MPKNELIDPEVSPIHSSKGRRKATGFDAPNIVSPGGALLTVAYLRHQNASDARAVSTKRLRTQRSAGADKWAFEPDPRALRRPRYISRHALRA